MDFKIGDVIKPITDTCGHSYKIGELYTIYKKDDDDKKGRYYLEDMRGGKGSNYILGADMIKGFRLKSEKIRWMMDNSVIILQGIDKKIVLIKASMDSLVIESQKYEAEMKQVIKKKRETKNFFRHINVETYKGKTREGEITELILQILACKQGDEVKKGKIYKVLKEHALITASPY